MNTWPDGERRPLTQAEHEAWNTRNYPGTRQLCCECEEPTGRCEEDSLICECGAGPFCEDCLIRHGDVHPPVQEGEHDD